MEPFSKGWETYWFKVISVQLLAEVSELSRASVAYVIGEYRLFKNYSRKVTKQTGTTKHSNIKGN